MPRGGAASKWGTLWVGVAARVPVPAPVPVGPEERQGPTGRLGLVRAGPSSEFRLRAVGILSVGFCFFPAVESEKGSEDECRVEGPEA